jgi:phosphoglucomutase
MDTAELKRKAEAYIASETHPRFRAEVEELVAREDWEQLSDRFYTTLAFGTGGMRGVIGGGTNRMNPLNIRRITQGLASYVLRATRSRSGAPGAQSAQPSAVIAHDSRRFSDLFAREAALVFAGNGIRAYVFSGLRPTPELSFAVRKLGATTGVVVTASHNPAQYNGYKVYWDDGAQVVAPDDKGIVDEVAAVKDVRSLQEDEARRRGLLVVADDQVDRAFLDSVKAQVLRPGLFRSAGKDLRVVYTPLHGTGAVPVAGALRELGIEVQIVPEQKEPDGEFPTVEYPNPEEASALKLALDLGRSTGADLVMGTDPDSDRLGIAARKGSDFALITGNQLGALLLDYVLSSRRELGSMPPRPMVIKTIVTTELHRRIAESYGAACIDTLTGFKYMAEKIRQFEAEKDGPSYVFGSEESYGYLIGTHVRDKDAVTASVVTVEMALYHKSRGAGILDALDSLYLKHGYFEEIGISRGFPGEKGMLLMAGLMDQLRKESPREWAGERVREVRDFRDDTVVEVASGRKGRGIGLPSSNVLQWVTEAGTFVTARPSGTEPKVKFYASCCTAAGVPLAAARAEVGARLNVIAGQVDRLLGSGGR